MLLQIIHVPRHIDVSSGVWAKGTSECDASGSCLLVTLLRHSDKCFESELTLTQAGKTPAGIG